MKKSFGLLMLLALFLTSCQTQLKTARTAVTDASLRSVAVADLEVADQRITYTMEPSKDIQRAGLSNVKQAAEQEALTKHGNADVLLDPQYVITKKRTLFGSKISSITVSGRPAYYRNFRTLNDSVWTNPAFNGVAVQGKSADRTSNNGFFAPSRKNKTEGYRKKGFDCYLSFSLLGASYSSEYDCGCKNAGFEAALLSSFGYRFGAHVYLGAGLGFVYNDFDCNGFIPIYANLRIDFSKKKNTFFFDYKMGCTPIDLGESIPGGLFATIGLGYSFGKLDVALQSMLQDYERDFCNYRNGSYCSGLIDSWGVSFSYNF